MRALYISLLLVAAGGLAAAVALPACGSDSSSDASGADGGADGPTANVDATPPGCDPGKEQRDQDACLSNDYAVFVATTGRADAPGTKEAPVDTIAHGLALAGGKKQRVFVCDGTYAERVTMTKPFSLYGGLSCAGGAWKASGDHATIGTPQEPGFALDVQKVSGAFEIVDLAFVAANGTDKAVNSIAARVVGTSGLTLKRVSLTAGDGAPGAEGASGKTGEHQDAMGNALDPKGDAGAGPVGGGEKVCHCSTGGTTTGGGGGGATNGNGTPGLPALGGTAPKDGQPGSGGDINCVSGKGHAGTDAADKSAAPAPTAFGSLSKDDWAPASGNAGESGTPGQGGGGGGANNGGGGGGGCGGCGGTGGQGGTGGGASIALLAINSPVHLSASTLTTAAGGKGGKGGAGGPGGTPGGAGDQGSGNPNSGCPGGVGGKGGAGGAGSGGPGGVSVGVVQVGAKPVLDGATKITTGKGGDGGDPAAAGANGGPAGTKADTLDATSS